MMAAHDTEDDRSRPPRILILGGGFGGINTALTLPNLPWTTPPEITLIDRDERFVFLPLLYELCVGDASLEEVAPTYKSLFQNANADIANDENDDMLKFMRGDVKGIDAAGRKVYLSSDNNNSEVMEYDALIVSTGMHADLNDDVVPGAARYALPFHTVEQCYELRRRFELLDAYLDKRVEEAVNVVVIGGGYSGVELALNAVERLGSHDNVKVTLVHRGGEVLEYAKEHSRLSSIKRLEEMGVEVMTETSVVEVLPLEEQEGGDKDAAAIQEQSCLVKVQGKEDGTVALLPANLLLWTAGFTTSNTNDGILNSALPRDSKGRIVTDEYLQVADDIKNIFALGDCARVKRKNGPYPGTAQVAMQQATVASWNAYSQLSNSNKKDGNADLLPFRFTDLGEMMTLGSDDATVTSLNGLVKIEGPMASWIRRVVYAVRMPTPRQGLRAALDGTERRLARSRAAKKKERKEKIIDGAKIKQ